MTIQLTRHDEALEVVRAINKAMRAEVAGAIYSVRQADLCYAEMLAADLAASLARDLKRLRLQDPYSYLNV